MALEQSEIAKIANLARLQISQTESSEIQASLSSILRLVDQMQAVDTSNIDPMAHPLDANQALRDDVISEKDQSKTYQRIAPAIENGLFLVPRVIE